MEFDQRRHGPEWVERLKPIFMAHHLASPPGVNHAILADEYSDKMASYLFGPTFLRQLHAGQFADDAVY